MRGRAAALALAGTLLVAGCGGGHRLPSSMARYTGHGVTLGYPKTWRTPKGGPKAVPAAVFEVVSPDRTPQVVSVGSIDVLAYTQRKEPEDDLVFAFVQESRIQQNFKLLGRHTVKAGNGSATEVAKEYDVPQPCSTLRIRAVDWFLQYENDPVVDVRVTFLADRYDARLVSDVRTSIRLR